MDCTFKVFVYFLFRYTTDCLVTFVHRQVNKVVQVGEHAHLAKLRHTGKQGELDVSVHRFQHAVEGFQGRAETVLQFGMGNGSQQGLVVLVYQDDYSLACLLIGLANDVLEALPSLVKRRQRAIQFFQGRKEGVELLVERLFGLVFSHVQVEMEYQVFRPVLLKLLDGKALEEFFLAREIRFQGGNEQALAKPPWTAQKVITSLVD